MTYYIGKNEFGVTTITGSPPPTQTMWEIEKRIPDFYLDDLKGHFEADLKIIKQIQDTGAIGALVSQLGKKTSIVIRSLGVVTSPD